MEHFTILPIFVPFFLVCLIWLLPVNKCVPTFAQLIGESLYGTIYLMTPKAHLFFPYLLTLFYIILVSNFIGLVPYSTTASTEIIITLTLSFLTLIGLLIFGIIQHGLSKFIYLFLPAGTPIFLLPLMIPLEILSYCTRTLSLGLRLAVNIITGHVLVKIILSLAFSSGKISIFHLLPILFLILFLSLEILIAYLQAYIFVFITIITLNDLLP